jgi:predicted phosphodiesterase
MKYAIISDIHSNYSALSCVLDEIKKEKVEKIFCCGDIVGYCGEPNECIERIKKENIISVLGNHDAVMIDKADLNWFNKDAKEALIINKQILTQENIKYFENLKDKEIFEDIIFVHGSLQDPVFEYLDNLSLLRRNIRMLEDKNICFCGHTHVPFIYIYDMLKNEEDLLIPSDEKYIYEVKKDCKYIINVGSVGQPRDNDNRACFVIYDTESLKVEFRRVEYNIFLTQQKMRDLKLPEFLIQRLEFGE